MTGSKHRYPEKRLQRVATDWLKGHWGYVEAYSDVEARGARMDSVGLLDGRLALIEIKRTVSSAIVDHRPDRAHSLESKIAGALGLLHRREADPVSEAASRIWDWSSPPLVCILAEKFSDLDDLKAMLTRRAPAWRFDFAVWRWTGQEIEVLASGQISLEQSERSYAAITVPRLVGRTLREKARSIPELIEIGRDRGIADLVTQLVQSAPQHGFKVHAGRWTIALKRRVQGCDKPQTVIGAYLDCSSPTGLMIGCWCDVVGIAEHELPGQPADRNAGYLNTNRIISTKEEVATILRIFS